MNNQEFKTQLINSFTHTQKMIKESEYLSKMTQKSIDNTVVLVNHVISEEKIKSAINDKKLRVVMSNQRTFEAAHDIYHSDSFDKEQHKIAALNFASARNPGGHVTTGASAQEEALCRVSNLYNVLSNSKIAKEAYYDYHKQHSAPWYSDNIIYSPDIVVFKKDVAVPDESQVLKEKDYSLVNVISSAAPNLIHETSISPDLLEDILTNRIRAIILTAITNDITHLILGCFGCGVFKNPPELVAICFMKVLLIPDAYYKIPLAWFFEELRFAIINDFRGTGNYDAFAKIIDDSLSFHATSILEK